MPTSTLSERQSVPASNAAKQVAICPPSEEYYDNFNWFIMISIFSFYKVYQNALCKREFLNRTNLSFIQNSIIKKLHR